MTNESTTTRRRTRAAASATTRPAAATASAEPLLQLLAAMQEVNAGDFSVKLPQHWDGIEGKLATAFNDIVNQNKRLATELARVGQNARRYISDHRQWRNNIIELLAFQQSLQEPRN